MNLFINSFKNFIDKFRLQGIIKLDKEKSRREKKNYYYFKYVGIIVYNNLVIKCYPKYIKNDDNDSIIKMALADESCNVDEIVDLALAVNVCLKYDDFEMTTTMKIKRYKELQKK